MRTLKSVLAVIIAFLFSISCHGNKPLAQTDELKTKDSTEAGNKYDYIQFERHGGGDKLFNLYPGSPDTLKAEVLRYNFRDTSAIVPITRIPETNAVFSTYYEILKGTKTILADSVSGNKMLMGTWTHYYAVKDSVKTEITDKAAKDSLSRFETILKEILTK